MVRMEGKVMDGRGGYMGLSLGLEKGVAVEVIAISKQSSELLLWVSVTV